METINRMPEHGEVLIVVTSNNEAKRIIIRDCDLLYVVWYLYDKRLIIGFLTAWQFTARRIVVRASYEHYNDAIMFLTKYAI